MTTDRTHRALPPLQAITAEQRAHYHEQGYLVVPDLFDAGAVQQMLDECDAIHRGDYGELFAGSAQIEPEFAEAAKTNPEIAKLARKFTAVIERSVIFRQAQTPPVAVQGPPRATAS